MGQKKWNCVLTTLPSQLVFYTASWPKRVFAICENLLLCVLLRFWKSWCHFDRLTLLQLWFDGIQGTCLNKFTTDHNVNFFQPSAKNFYKFWFFKMFALVKVVQNEKFQDKNCSQNFGLGKNKQFEIFRSLTVILWELLWYYF